VSRRIIARVEGTDTLVSLPHRSTDAPVRLGPVGETVEARPLDVYAELAR
jgi:hypothetical protein